LATSSSSSSLGSSNSIRARARDRSWPTTSRPQRFTRSPRTTPRLRGTTRRRPSDLERQP
jgi:hypothetical protein